MVLKIDEPPICAAGMTARWKLLGAVAKAVAHTMIENNGYRRIRNFMFPAFGAISMFQSQRNETNPLFVVE